LIKNRPAKKLVGIKSTFYGQTSRLKKKIQKQALHCKIF